LGEFDAGYDILSDPQSAIFTSAHNVVYPHSRQLDEAVNRATHSARSMDILKYLKASRQDWLHTMGRSSFASARDRSFDAFGPKRRPGREPVSAGGRFRAPAQRRAYISALLDGIDQGSPSIQE
jgi:hypothetical protein